VCGGYLAPPQVGGRAVGQMTGQEGERGRGALTIFLCSLVEKWRDGRTSSKCRKEEHYSDEKSSAALAGVPPSCCGALTHTGGPSVTSKTKPPLSFTAPSTDSDFQQQNLKAWQTLLTPGWIIGTFAFIGIIFVPIGIIVLMASQGGC
jgi:hypothetical protein